jgi:hypothetical protein
MEPVFVIGFFALIVAIAIFSYRANQKRQEAMKALAARLGLHYSPGKDRTLASRYEFIDRIRGGRDRYAFNILSGAYQGHEVNVFDYHYVTGSGKNTRHHYPSFLILRLPISTPELTIGPEGLFSKVAQAIGFDDIDFESHEFSRKFCVRSRDKKFAYDICHGRMIEYLLANTDLTLEMERDILAISFMSRLDPEKIEFNLERLIAVRMLMPEYLLDRSWS